MTATMGVSQHATTHNAKTPAARKPLVHPASPSALPPVLRKSGCSCGGGCASCQSAHMAGPDHPAEREAEAVAEQVVSMAEPTQSPTVAGDVAPQPVQRMEEEEEPIQMMEEEEEPVQMMGSEEEEEPLQMKSTAGGAGPAGSAATKATQGLGAGRALPAETRGFFERRMGADFSNVRVHDGVDAAARARDINAQAYTFGRNIVFNKDRYDPASTEGRRLLAHELTHVMQQGKAGPMVQRQASLTAEQRMMIESTIRMLNQSPLFFGNEGTEVDRAMFDRVMNGWLSAITNQDKMAASDTDLQTRLRAAYRSAIQSLIQEFATDSGKDVADLWVENSGRIPMWAWQEAHETRAGTSTPIAESQSVDAATGNATGTTNGVALTILPDAVDTTLTDHAVTRSGLNYSVSYSSNRNNNPTRFWGLTIAWTMSIQTFYPEAFGADAQSGYGRGTTPEDTAGGQQLERSTTLGHHEGEHGLAYQRFLAANALPTIANPGTAANRLTKAQYDAELAAFRTALCDYSRRMNEHSFQEVDCPGTGIGHSHTVPASNGCAAYTLTCP